MGEPGELSLCGLTMGGHVMMNGLEGGETVS